MTAAQIKARILARTDDASAITASDEEVLAVINEGQELASLLTLCLETVATLTLTAATTFGSLRAAFPDFLCPLRLSIAGARIRPATLAELDAEAEGWQASPGTPERYCTMGFNFYAVTPQPAIDTAADFVYARSPAPLVLDDFPELPEEYHQSLVDFGKYRLRLKEGGQGLARGMVSLNRFLDDMTRLGDYVRARSRAARYDVLPFELALFDRSRLMLPKPKPVRKPVPESQ